MDDLGSQSYSSANPSYYLFCAFKYRDDITKAEVEILNEVHSNISNAYLLMKIVFQTEHITRNLVACLNVFIT